MRYGFENGAIVAAGKLFEKAAYDVSNTVFGATFNGRGAVSRYSPANEAAADFDKLHFINYSYNGRAMDMLADKTVTMLGRKQTVKIDLEGAFLEISLFLAKDVNGIFASYRLITEHAADALEMRLVGYHFKGRLPEGGALRDGKKAFATDKPFDYIDENATVAFTLTAADPCRNTVLIYGKETVPAEQCVDNFDAYARELDDEFAAIRLPAGLDEREKALFYSSCYCALENYKELDGFKGFMAGCDYLSPVRTYYRDAYFTVLAMYAGHTDKVRAQILTLASGIREDGTCPSAIKFDGSAFWGDHYDSPSFLAMMLYDYVNFTGDLSVTDVSLGDATVFEKAVMALEALATHADKTGLIYKDGRYNKRDWADEVNRYGYVTYDELLYARALYSAAGVCRLKGDGRYKEYDRRFKKVKKAINDILWDDDLGYYVNFKNEDYPETNLSVDTVFAAIFGIADDGRARRMLAAMERLLETQNNGTPEPFGCMSVYPFYSNPDGASHRSSQPYNYHNGANWPYLTAMYAYAKRKFGMEYKYLLTGWFDYNLKKGNYTPIEYFSPYCDDGSLLQAWSSDTAFVLDETISAGFWD